LSGKVLAASTKTPDEIERPSNVENDDVAGAAYKRGRFFGVEAKFDL